MKKFLLVIATVLLALPSFADCILNSTEFHKAYMDEPLVKKATQYQGLFTNAQKEYLLDDNNPFDIRTAIINAFGFSLGERDFYGEMMEYMRDNLPKKNNINTTKELSDEEIYEMASAEQLVILAYLNALDDLLDERDLTMMLVDKALAKPHKNCQSFMLPVTLIQVQDMDFSDRSNEVYPTFEKQVLLAPIKDVRTAGMEEVMDYISYYIK